MEDYTARDESCGAEIQLPWIKDIFLKYRKSGKYFAWRKSLNATQNLHEYKENELTRSESWRTRMGTLM